MQLGAGQIVGIHAVKDQNLAAGEGQLRMLGAIAVGLAVWEVYTAKLGTLPPPFFAPPQSLAEVYISDWARLLDSARN